MVSPSSLRSATRAHNGVRHPAMPPQPPTEAALRATISCLESEKAELGRKVASQANELVEVRGILAESLNVIATRFAELERQTAVLEAAHRINNAQLEHLQVEHLLSKLSIADEVILGFREAFSNVEEHVVEMETLFEEQIAELKAEKESIINDLVQTFQAYCDVGDLATSALLAHHADLERPLRFASLLIEADTPELEALLESVPTLDSMVLGHMICCPFPPSTMTDSPVPVHGHIAPPSSPALSSLSTNDSLPDLIPLSDSSSSSVSSKRSSEEMEKGMEEDWSIVDNKRPKLRAPFVTVNVGWSTIP
ncbi:hypothetical protein BT96DRAFT_1032809 [Gymnopus androsaceus JB14]|uniref:Uncharacterized protein n=1 Tax=Gymnopus androsaceus JB14 TaxID=1447944 RepID=A0A6A4HM08_9AGAR|nr:hypothetical protein BT96DRAFT_1032809 [Gymnopus androsaceus JB14]